MQGIKNRMVRRLMPAICLLVLAACGSQTSAPTHTSGQADPSTSKYRPTPPQPREVGERLVGPKVYTVDARSKEVWMYFDFSRGSVVAVQNPKTGSWDLAFRRHVIRSNGGDTNPAGQAAVANLGGRDFTAVTQVPDDAAFTRDVRSKKHPFPYNPAVDKWYRYSYLAHVLVPKPVVYIVRTQDGKYAKLRLLSYYCNGGVAGCMSFEYVYQGNGSTDLAAPSSRVSQERQKR